MEVDKVVFTYNYVRNISHLALEEAKQKEKRRDDNCIISMLFTAFCLEGYLNHIGSEKTEFWMHIEHCKPREKLAVLAKVLNHDIDWSCRPFQTFDAIFSFRNKLVHPKTHYLSMGGEQKLDEKGHPTLPLSGWEKMVNLGMAEKFFNDSTKIIETLHSKAGFEGSPIGLLEETTCKEV